MLDGLGGALLVACLGLGLAWVFGAVALQTPGARELREPIQRSAILRALNEHLPPSGPILKALARFDPLPQIDGPRADVAPPNARIARDPEVRAAAASVVRVLGTACGLGVQGSGWVAGDGVVVTNAHVVAGQDDTTVQVGGDGPIADAEAIWFDARNDLAILRAPDVAGVPALRLRANAPAGTAAAILGFPHNGPFDLRPGRLGETELIRTQDAYGQGPVPRRITSFRGLVRSGNSGGPVVDGDGRVLATVFAATVDDGGRHGFGVPDSVVGRRAGPGRRAGRHRTLRTLIARTTRCAQPFLPRRARRRGVRPRARTGVERRCPRRPRRAGPGPQSVRRPRGRHAALPGPDDAPAVGALHRPADQAGAHGAAGRQLDRQHRRRAGRAARDAQRQALDARPPAHPAARREPHRREHRRAAAVQVRPPAALLVEVLRRRPLRALARWTPGGRKVERVRVGPKVAYCLRDLERTRPRLAHSPRRRIYPACSNDPKRKRVTLGTSIGWSDVYPPAYPEQWIDVTGLRGCFAYVHIADPENGIFESNEQNNRAQVIVRLPFELGQRRRGCPGPDRGMPYRDGTYGDGY